MSKNPLSWPETNILFFGTLLNIPWELFQMPLFAEPPDLDYRLVVNVCTAASVADGVIMIIAFWAASFVMKSRQWFHAPTARPYLTYLGAGLAITILIEIAATQSGAWNYGPLMPVVLGVGLSPFFQWVFLPPLTLWFTQRQLR